MAGKTASDVGRTECGSGLGAKATAGLERAIRNARGSTGRYARDLVRLQRAPRAEVDAYQERRLRGLLQHAATHVPYYAAVLREAGVVNGQGGVDLSRFSQIPLLDKTIIWAQGDGMLSDDAAARGMAHDYTSGSTGRPLHVVHDRDYADWLRAGPALGDSMIGRRPGERRLYLWGFMRDGVAGREALRTRVDRWMRNEVWLNGFRMSPEEMARYVDVINRCRPDHVIAYVDSAVELAQFIERTGRTVHGPRTVSTSAGTLEPHMRELLQRVFKAGVFNQYGSREIASLANECERHEGLHVTMPLVLIEILRQDGSAASAGELGEIVVTSLANYVQPFIRYRIGDVGSWAEQPCSCGRSWPLLRSVAGRVNGTFVSPEGRLVPGVFFSAILREQAAWVDKYQVIQEAPELFRVIVVAHAGVSEAVKAQGMDEVTRRTRSIMGQACEVTFEFIDVLERSPSGKRMSTISKVTPDWLADATLQPPDDGDDA